MRCIDIYFKDITAYMFFYFRTYILFHFHIYSFAISLFLFNCLVAVAELLYIMDICYSFVAYIILIFCNSYSHKCYYFYLLLLLLFYGDREGVSIWIYIVTSPS
ncbi:hypothetical protein V1511DRAFT_121440 [Dipodascopsis uninucleata]